MQGVIMQFAEYLAPQEVERLHEASLEILENVGVFVRNERARAVYSGHGCKVDSETSIVKMPRNVIEEYRKAFVPNFTFRGRDPKFDRTIPLERPVVVTGSSAPDIIDRRTGKERRATSSDIADIAFLINELPGYDVFSMFAASHPNFGLRPSDGFLVDSLAEMVVDFEALAKVAFYTSLGANIGSTSTPLFGGYNGGAEGNAIVAVVYNLLGILIFRGTYHYNAPLHAKLRVSSTRPLLWIIALANQALHRNAPYPTLNLPYLGGGAGTDCYYYEMAAYHTCVVTSGGNMLSGHPGMSVVPDSIVLLDHLLNIEAAEAASKLTRKEANPVVLKLLEKYENQLKNPPKGLTYQDCYDPVSGKLINSGYVKHVDEIREELKNLGLPVMKSG